MEKNTLIMQSPQKTSDGEKVDGSLYYTYLSRSNWWRMNNYINLEAAENLRDYRYIGGDTGLTYSRCYSPLADWFVTLFPMWVAPNVLTLIGFLYTFVPFVYVFAVWGTTFDDTGVPDSKIAPWFFFLFAIAYFLYRLFDEADGKQARRTGNSSALGMLFDHGCDAFTVTFVIATSAKFMNFGNDIRTIIWFSLCISLFYFAQLEEYYVGGMILGFGNPISDLSIFVYFQYICYGIWGHEILTIVAFTPGQLFENSPALNLLDLWYNITVVFMSANIFVCWYKIFTKERFEGKGRDAKFMTVMYQSFAYVAMVVLVISLGYCGKDPMFSMTKEKGSWAGFWIMMLQGMIMQHMSSHVMLFEATRMHYNPLDNRLYVFVMFAMSMIQVFNKSIDVKMSVISLTIITVMCTMHFLINLVYELTVVLKIRVFKVKQSHQITDDLSLK